ncbi:AraD1 family protein [Pseudomonas typographi]|uniref:FAH family protein n=1 Tax=Pseudomonas typographi TaxID=2715964 RepID=A0ABR7Z145_9PSED|nr:AraD1 family protein [Pseudomonas typographi]MBD1554796.1 FAH family protein [Pseudomonas typographi]MBD1587319.1 FAH family protein [Pseudomonas typographi]MBD1599185.1 FAH family protein [Pseudomonas typographi]
MRLIQFDSAAGERRVGTVAGQTLQVVNQVASTRELALLAIGNGCSLAEQVATLGTKPGPVYLDLLAAGRVLPPLDHPDPAHCWVTGTGLTHLGSASTRDAMHQANAPRTDEATLTDTARMFKWGVEGGKPAAGQVGVQPEWFFKGDGDSVVRPGADLPMPEFAEDGGEEPELAGLYVIGNDGQPYRLGYALGNEFSDHVMEKRNYLYLAHSKLRACSYGPELRVGPLPADLNGHSRLYRGAEVVWEKAFASGEANMCHSFDNLEFHHFKYDLFLRPGDVHVHFFGTATLSFADGIQPQPGDRFEVAMGEFGAPLVNGLAVTTPRFGLGKVRAL